MALEDHLVSPFDVTPISNSISHQILFSDPSPANSYLLTESPSMSSSMPNEAAFFDKFSKTKTKKSFCYLSMDLQIL